ncbi:MAG: helix-turn-helix domain-containing protein [Desulfobacterales bacterium]
MNQITTIINEEELFKDFFELNEFHNSEGSFELHGKWPDEIGNGFTYVNALRPGLVLATGYAQVRRNLTVTYEVKSSSFVHLAFSYSGKFYCTFSYGQGKKDAHIFNSGQSFISYLPELRGIAKYLSSTPSGAVNIYIDKILLDKLMEGQHDQIPAGLNDIMGGANESYYCPPSNMTPAMKVAIRQILNCSYRGLLKRVYLESKVMELIVHKLAQGMPLENGLTNPSPLHRDDIERIHEARDILIRNLENLPSVLKLARQVGINKNKLNQGFREVFGTSVFDYLLNYRLEQAKQFLEDRRMSITEVAFTVGYAHPSTFTAAFKRHFGATPKRYMQ